MIPSFFRHLVILSVDATCRHVALVAADLILFCLSESLAPVDDKPSDKWLVTVVNRLSTAKLRR